MASLILYKLNILLNTNVILVIGRKTYYFFTRHFMKFYGRSQRLINNTPGYWLTFEIRLGLSRLVTAT